MLGLCDRFHCLPSQLDGEDAGELLQMIAIERRAFPERYDTNGQ